MRTMLLPLAAILLAAAGPMTPADETWAAATVEAFAARIDQAANKLAAGALRRERARTLCAASGPLKRALGVAKDWTGTIADLDSTEDGRGILAIQLSAHFLVATVNNQISERMSETPTLLAPGSAAYQAAMALHTGQRVRFSGSFFPSASDCMALIGAPALGLSNDADFLFRFTALAPGD